MPKISYLVGESYELKDTKSRYDTSGYEGNAFLFNEVGDLSFPLTKSGLNRKATELGLISSDS